MLRFLQIWSNSFSMWVRGNLMTLMTEADWTGCAARHLLPPSPNLSLIWPLQLPEELRNKQKNRFKTMKQSGKVQQKAELWRKKVTVSVVMNSVDNSTLDPLICPPTHGQPPARRGNRTIVFWCGFTMNGFSWGQSVILEPPPPQPQMISLAHDQMRVRRGAGIFLSDGF